MKRRDLSSDRASSSLEFAVIAPGLLIIISVIVFAGRVAIAHQAVEAAAADAARAASIARSRPAATSDATRTAASSLRSQRLQCTSLDVRVDTAGFAAPVGTPATITAAVSCTVNLSDLAVPGLPGTKTVAANASSPLDTYRERTSGFTHSEGLSGGS